MVNKRKRAKGTSSRRYLVTGSPEMLRSQGKSAFDQEDYTSAIQIWEKARGMAVDDESATASLTAALAEAYFRRGVTSPSPDLDDLVQAAALVPDDPRFSYHLARARQQQGQWDDAIARYRQLLAQDPPYARAAFPLAVALTLRREDVVADPVWGRLSPSERDRLIGAQTLAKRRRSAGSLRVLHQEGDALWAGLAGVALRLPDAAIALQTALDDPDLPATAAAVVHHYLGVLAWQQDDHAQALVHWQTAYESGLETSWLHQNMVGAFERMALACLGNGSQEMEDAAAGADSQMADRVAEALRLADQGLRLAPDDPGLLEIKRYASFHLGYAAAMAGQWPTALDHWRAAQRADDSSRALLTNMAVAYEKLEKYAQSADLWRQVIRRRPRKADAPGALDDKQLARMWRHVAQNYRKAGDYEEATRAYRNALKRDPSNIDLQLDLVESLMADGRAVAASTVVNGVLATQPDHVEALAWQAQVFEQGLYLEAAQTTWQRVLALDPQHPHARQHLAHLHEYDGDRERRKNNFEEAIAAYQKGLEYTPGNVRLYTSIGRCYAQMQDPERAHQQFELAVHKEPHNLEAYYWAIQAWLQLDNWRNAQALLEEVQVMEPPPQIGFYLDLSSYCRRLDRITWAKDILEWVEGRYPDNPQVLTQMGITLQENDEAEPAVACFQRAIELDPNLAEAHIQLGVYYLSVVRQPHMAERHLNEAERIGRESDDVVTRFQVRAIRDRFGDAGGGSDNRWGNVQNR
jgi:tetratricopeptide (TPR) repeat protein